MISTHSLYCSLNDWKITFYSIPYVEYFVLRHSEYIKVETWSEWWWRPGTSLRSQYQTAMTLILFLWSNRWTWWGFFFITAVLIWVQVYAFVLVFNILLLASGEFMVPVVYESLSRRLTLEQGLYSSLLQKTNWNLWKVFHFAVMYITQIKPASSIVPTWIVICGMDFINKLFKADFFWVNLWLFIYARVGLCAVFCLSSFRGKFTYNFVLC